MFGTLTLTITKLALRSALFPGAADPRNSIVAGGLLLILKGLI